MVSFNRVVIGGALVGGAEQWSTSCAFFAPAGDPVSAPSQLTAWAEDIATEINGTALTTEMLNGLGANGTVNEIRTYFYASESAPASAVGIATAAKNGLTSIDRPPSVAAVLSLSTGLAGRRYRGRMYWPALGNTINTTGRFSSSVTDGLSVGGANLLTQIAFVAPNPSPMVPAVVSKAGGFITEVIAVRVGDVPDGMRSRRDALDELYDTTLL